MKILLSKTWGWLFKSSLYLEKSKRYGEFAIYLIIYMAAMLVFGGRWEYFTILYDILIDENVGIDTQNKSVDGLIRKIFVIEWFQLINMLIRSITQNSTVENIGTDTKTKYLERFIRKMFEWFLLISMLIRSITKNAMDKKFSIRQFLSPEHPYIAFPQKNLAVLDISRFTFCKVDYNTATGSTCVCVGLHVKIIE